VGAELVRLFDRFRELVAVIPIGYFGASTGAAALVAATKRPDVIVASRNRKFRQRAHERDRARTLALRLVVWLAR
jgi:hypothetical protein